MSAPDCIVARQKITDLKGKVLLYMDKSGRSISQKTFEILTSYVTQEVSPAKRGFRCICGGERNVTHGFAMT